MLCQFSVKNYQCLKDEITFDMQATNITEHNESLIVDSDDERFLPLGVIYGPNGSGKSTVLAALYSLCSKIMKPICAVGCDNTECAKRNGGALIKPFKFSKDTVNQPTTFELFFRTQKNEYQYFISILKDRVVNEELYKKLEKVSTLTELEEYENTVNDIYGQMPNNVSMLIEKKRIELEWYNRIQIQKNTDNFSNVLPSTPCESRVKQNINLSQTSIEEDNIQERSCFTCIYNLSWGNRNGMAKCGKSQIANLVTPDCAKTCKWFKRKS